MSTKKKDTRNYQDRGEYLKKAVAKRRKTLKLQAISLYGNKCSLYGYNKHPGVLEFHHVDPLTKLFGISADGFSRSWKSIVLETKKCLLVCANCHKEIELGLHKKEFIDTLYRQLHNT